MKTSCGKFLNLVHYFPYDVKLRLLAHSRCFLANQKARNAIVGAENLLNFNSPLKHRTRGTGAHFTLAFSVACIGDIFRQTAERPFNYETSHFPGY